MNYDEFLASILNKEPHLNLKPELNALWFDKNKNWKKAHEIIQNEEGKNAALIHAYLHRK